MFLIFGQSFKKLSLLIAPNKFDLLEECFDHKSKKLNRDLMRGLTSVSFLILHL